MVYLRHGLTMTHNTNCRNQDMAKFFELPPERLSSYFNFFSLLGLPDFGSLILPNVPTFGEDLELTEGK